jgi:hypothetical protein
MQGHNVWFMKKHTGIAVKNMLALEMFCVTNECMKRFLFTGKDRWIRDKAACSRSGANAHQYNGSN